MNDNCPVQAPKLLKAKSTVETCASCGAWVDRYPSFYGESDGYWECDKCGCTSVKLRDGRPFSKKSRKWDEVVQVFEECYLDIPQWDWNTIVTEPPMITLDWGAVEEWYRSQNIYRIFINVGTVEHIESK